MYQSCRVFIYTVPFQGVLLVQEAFLAFESSEKFLMVDYVNLFLLPNHSMPLHREKVTYLGKQV
jgi:hypothetical protein